jgi:hypothetical protein
MKKSKEATLNVCVFALLKKKKKKKQLSRKSVGGTHSVLYTEEQSLQSEVLHQTSQMPS